MAELLGFLVAGLFGAVLVVLALPRRRMIAAITFALCFTISVGVLAYHAPAEAVQDQVQTGYVVNQRSGMAHHADCMYAAQISDENRVYFTESELGCCPDRGRYALQPLFCTDDGNGRIR